MRSRFGPLAYENPMTEIKKLKLTGFLQDYLKEFELLLDEAQLSESQAFSYFFSRFKA